MENSHVPNPIIIDLSWPSLENPIPPKSEKQEFLLVEGNDAARGKSAAGIVPGTDLKERLAGLGDADAEWAEPASLVVGGLRTPVTLYVRGTGFP